MSCCGSAGSDSRTGRWRQLPTRCDDVGSRKGIFLPIHVPRYLIYQPLNVWGCFPVDKPFHSPVRTQNRNECTMAWRCHHTLFLATRLLLALSPLPGISPLCPHFPSADPIRVNSDISSPKECCNWLLLIVRNRLTQPRLSTDCRGMDVARIIVKAIRGMCSWTPTRKSNDLLLQFVSPHRLTVRS